MAAEHKRVDEVGGLKERQADKRRLLDVESTISIRRQVILKQLVLNLDGPVAAVLFIQSNIQMAVDHLDRAIKVLPEKGAAQDRVTIDHCLPGTLERRCI